MTTADLHRTFTVLSGICLPDEVESGQLVGVTVRYLEPHLESRHEPVRGLVFISYQEAFPCSAR